MSGHGQKLEVFCQRDPWCQGVRFWLKQTTWSPDRVTTAYATTLELKCVDEGVEPHPAFRLHDEQAQAFMDELWRVGFRPTEGTGSAGSLAATERHLEDMRALVFKKEPKA